MMAWMRKKNVGLINHKYFLRTDQSLKTNRHNFFVVKTNKIKMMFKKISKEYWTKREYFQNNFGLSFKKGD